MTHRSRLASRVGSSVVALAVAVASLAIAGDARADRKAEAAAKQALKKAEDDYLAMAFDKALGRLVAAEKRCGDTGCAPATRAALVRDVGVMQLRLGQRDAALASFRRAKKADATIALNPSYDAPDLREAWESSTPPPQTPGGDFVHTPPGGETPRTPLPIYVEAASADVVRVVVRYSSASTKSFRRATLDRLDKGWGGYVPCADVVPADVRYYFQGFDKDGELVANGGDAAHPYVVRVRDSIGGEAPSLPGKPPPKVCGDEELETLNLADGERCTEDRQCKSGGCANGVCSASSAPPEASPEEDAVEPARLWIGASASVDLTLIPADAEVCSPASAYWCTTGDGNDYDGAKLIAGRGGATTNDFTTGGVHVALSIDYAASGNVLVGGRFGFVGASYPGKAAADAGKTVGFPLHAELRGTYVFGDAPLARPGVAPYVMLAAGYARFDASSTVQVGEKNVVGDHAVQVWRVAGPAFAEVGVGARYMFSPRAAAALGLDFAAAVGPGAFGFFGSPEIAVQYGF